MNARILIVVLIVTAMALAACGPGTKGQAGSASLEGTEWSLTAFVEGEMPTSLVSGTAITLRFEKGQVRGSAGCNDYGGPYTLERGALRIGGVAITEQFCVEPAGIMEQETEYVDILRNVAIFEWDGEGLTLRTADGRGLAFIAILETVTPPTPGDEWGEAAATPDVAATVMAIQAPRLHGSYASPDGEWRAEIAIYDCIQVAGADENAYERLRLVQVSSGKEVVVAGQLQYCGGLGAAGLDGLFWSSNSRYFYYTDAREGVPDGCGYWERPIMRVDVTDQHVERLGGGPLSPDGSRLATWSGQELIVWDVNGEEIARTPALVPDAEAGPIAWSPDGETLVYVQFASYCPLSGKSYVVRVDLPELEQTLLLESETPTFGDVDWDVPDELRLLDEEGKGWRYSLVTQRLQAP